MSLPPSPLMTQPSPVPATPTPTAGGQGLAITGIVLAAIGMLGVLVPFRIIPDLVGMALAIAGVVCGHIAWGRGQARGAATAALIVGYIALGVGLLHFFSLVTLGYILRHRLGR